MKFQQSVTPILVVGFVVIGLVSFGFSLGMNEHEKIVKNQVELAEFFNKIFLNHSIGQGQEIVSLDSGATWVLTKRNNDNSFSIVGPASPEVVKKTLGWINFFHYIEKERQKTGSDHIALTANPEQVKVLKDAGITVVGY